MAVWPLGQWKAICPHRPNYCHLDTWHAFLQQFQYESPLYDLLRIEIYEKTLYTKGISDGIRCNPGLAIKRVR